MNWNAGEVPYLTTWPLDGVLVWVFKALMDLKFFEQPTAVKRFNRGRRESPYPERELLQWRVRILRLFEDQGGAFGQGQLTGKE